MLTRTTAGPSNIANRINKINQSLSNMKRIEGFVNEKKKKRFSIFVEIKNTISFFLFFSLVSSSWNEMYYFFFVFYKINFYILQKIRSFRERWWKIVAEINTIYIREICNNSYMYVLWIYLKKKKKERRKEKKEKILDLENDKKIKMKIETEFRNILKSNVNARINTNLDFKNSKNIFFL